MDVDDLVVLLREVAPQLSFERCVPLASGWDTVAFELDGAYVVRVPQREQTAETLRKESMLLPELRRLDLPVPEVVAAHFGGAWWRSFVIHRKLEGEPVEPQTTSPALAEEIGRVLRSVHAFPVERARSLGVPGDAAGSWRSVLATHRQRMEEAVIPLLPRDARSSGAALWSNYLDDDANFSHEVVLAHSDLGPSHILVRGDRLAGFIDWGDAQLADPAIDFAWLLYGGGERIAAAVWNAYQPDDPAMRERERFFHQIGPWYEVLYGVETRQDAFVRSGIEGVLLRAGRGVDPLG